MSEILNAKIGSTMLGSEDHGILTLFVNVEGDGWGQGFGGYALDGPWDERQKIRLPSAECGRWINGILNALEIERWEKLPGTIVRVKRGDTQVLEAIGHAYKDRWFYAKESGA
jgi:hypothetical protein